GTNGQNANANDFFGLGTSPNNSEITVQQILSFSGTFTSMYCSVQANAGATLTFTLRKQTLPAAAANTTLTCTINAGSRTGVTTGASVAFSAGDLIAIGVRAANPNSPVSVA